RRQVLHRSRPHVRLQHRRPGSLRVGALRLDMSSAASLLEAIQRDPRYQRNLDWGEPRPGHPEGTVRAHIASVEANIDRLAPRLSADELAKLRILAHTHDSFKADAAQGVPIDDPRGHASLAAEYLASLGADEDLVAMAQLHDVPHALWRRF